MLKVKVKGIPVFYAGVRHEKGAELTIENDHQNESLFEVLEEIQDDPFKGVKADKLRKALEAAGFEIPEKADRETLIQIIKENEVQF